MAGSSISAQGQIKCPKCGHSLNKSLTELKANAHFACPHCGAAIKIQGRGFESAGRGLQNLAKAAARLGRKR